MRPSASSCLDEDTLLLLVTGKLEPNRLHRAEAHVASCRDCQQLIVDASAGLEHTHEDVAASSTHGRTSDLASTPPDLNPGEIIAGKYRVTGSLGRGGMGSVLSATHIELEQRVAIKVLHSEGADSLARFRREGRVLAQLSSPHVVRVFDSGHLEDGRPFIVMEHLDGADLATIAARGELTPAEAIDAIRQACAALALAHRAGIVHRDLKPSNLFLVQEHGQRVLKVLDFGISKQLTPRNESVSLTTTGALLGSPRYMAPEQLNGQDGVSAASDIWALGAILYELLTGRPAFPQTTFTALLIAIASHAPASPSKFRSDLPTRLLAVVMRCLEQDPRKRFSSVEELSNALAAFAQLARPAARPYSAVERKTPYARQLILLSGLILMLSAIILWMRSGRETTATDTKAVISQPAPSIPATPPDAPPPEAPQPKAAEATEAEKPPPPPRPAPPSRPARGVNPARKAPTATIQSKPLGPLDSPD